VPLTLLFRHLRNDATTLIGGGATAFMRLGNHHEAEQAASFTGRQHTFVLSSLTATHGTDQTTTQGQTETSGHSQSRSSGSSTGWTRDHLLDGGNTTGSHTRSRDHSTNYSWAAEPQPAWPPPRPPDPRSWRRLRRRPTRCSSGAAPCSRYPDQQTICELRAVAQG
jgi:hypothetical protein